MRTGLLILLIFNTSTTFSQVFPDTYDTPPAGYTGRLFKLSQNYPSTPPVAEPQPWLKIDFKTHPLEYLQCVYQYVLDGNIDCDWVPQNNTVRKWYHAPWMHWNDRPDNVVTGRRECVSGLTRERDSHPHELHELQYNSVQNWAIGMYNPTAGYIIGQVWKNPQHPNPAAAHFPYGSVSAKLLYTDADSSTVPYLRGSPEREVYVYSHVSETKKRVVKKLRLLQLDVVVRDQRANDGSGWVFGTLIYDAAILNENPWKRMLPVGISWGNDAGINPINVKTSGLHETYINPQVKNRLKLGWAGRLNGPVDNPNSSCVSCHSTASYPLLMDPNPDDNMSESERMNWFKKNIRSGETSIKGTTSLDYSLQLSTGIKNFYDWKKINFNQTFLQKSAIKVNWILSNGMWIPLLLVFTLFVFGGKYFSEIFVNQQQQTLQLALLVFRIAIGVLFIIHGYPKMMNGPAGWVRLGQSMANYGIYSFPMFWGFMSAIAEFGGGILLVLGLWFRPACLLLITNMSVASIKHIASGDSFSTASHAIELLFVFIFLLMIGPGKYSIDTLLYPSSKSKPH